MITDLDAIPTPEPAAGLIGLDDALSDLACFDRRKAQVIEFRLFGGLSGNICASRDLVAGCDAGLLATVWLSPQLSR